MFICVWRHAGKSQYSIIFYAITLEGRQSITNDFAKISFHRILFFLFFFVCCFSAALVELAKSIPAHSLILSSRLFFCPSLLLLPFTVSCRIVFAKPEDLETWPQNLSFRFLTWVMNSPYNSQIWDLALQNLYKWWTWVDLGLFYGKAAFGFLGFCMEKMKKCIFMLLCFLIENVFKCKPCEILEVNVF